MAIYHFAMQVAKRSEGRNAIAMVAYRAGEALKDLATDVIKDYTSKTKVFFAEILAPKNAPAWVQDRQTLWNNVEQSEKRKDAQVAREINVALPLELTPEQMRNLVTEYVQGQFVALGMVADVAYHDIDGKNPHAHIMLTMRELDGQGGFGLKNRDWNSKDNLMKWREGWAEYANKHLELAGSKERIDHRSLLDQGVDREPQIHVGVTFNAQTPSIRKLRNDAIIKKNQEKLAQVKALGANPPSIDLLQEEIQKAEAEIEQKFSKNCKFWSLGEEYGRVKDEAIKTLDWLVWRNQKLTEEIEYDKNFCKKNKWLPWKWNDVLKVRKECNDNIREYNSNLEKIENARIVKAFTATKQETHLKQENIVREKEREQTRQKEKAIKKTLSKYRKPKEKENDKDNDIGR